LRLNNNKSLLGTTHNRPPGASIHPDDRLRLGEEPTGHSEVVVGLDDKCSTVERSRSEAALPVWREHSVKTNSLLDCFVDSCQDRVRQQSI
jgi:hypothetical protein